MNNQKLKQYRYNYDRAKKILEAKNYVLSDEVKEYDESDELKEVLIKISILNQISKEMTDSVDRICGDLDGSKHLNSLYNLYGNAMLILENAIKYTDGVLTGVISMKYFNHKDVFDINYRKQLAAITTGALCLWSRMIDQLAKLGR